MPPAFAEQLRAWFREHARDLPWRGTRNPYAIMVSEFMLQQTQVATVVPYFERWMSRFPNVKSLAAAAEEEVLSHWQGLGYYSRARNLHRAAQLLGKDFPNTLMEMKKLPGMGDYTAGAILTFAFDQRVPIVDANIARVLSRLFNLDEVIDSAAGKKRVWEIAAQLLPNEAVGEFNAAIMELGALICTPRPQCEKCPVQEFCLAEKPELLPRKSPKVAVTRRIERACYVKHGDQVAMVQRTENPWRGMWVLPERITGSDVLEMPVMTHSYGITRYRVSLEIYETEITGSVRWCTPAEIATLPIPSPHRRVLETLFQRSLPLLEAV